jgi:hydrogenase maturation protease
MGAAAVDGSTMIIGYGNDLRGDDGAGPWVAARIEERRFAGVRVRIAHQLLPELASELATCDRAVFVDARQGDECDRVDVAIVRPAIDGSSEFTFHEGTPERILALSQRLYGRAPTAWLISIPGQDFNLGAPLSEIASEHCESAVALIHGLLGC